MIKSFLFQMCLLSFVLIHLLNSGNCIVTQEEIDQIRNEMHSPDTRKGAFEKLGKIVLDNDENDLKTARELVNEMLNSNDMELKNESLVFSSVHNRKLRNSRECARIIIDIMKEDRYKQYHKPLAQLLSHFIFRRKDGAE